MNELSIFNYEQKEVRTVQVDGEPWFVAKDVCDVLELSNPTAAVAELDDDERSKFNLGRQGQANIINEPGLYSLILRSRKPEAKAFKRWITHEVLPAIRKTGSYATPQQPSPVPNIKTANGLLEVDKAFRAALRMAKAIGLDTNAAIISANQLARKVTGSDALQLLEVRGIERPVEDHPLTPTEIGKFIGNLSGQTINKQLTLAGLQVKNGDIYTPTTKGAEFAVLLDTGKRHGDGTPIHQLKWKRRVVDQLKRSILDQVEPEAVTEN